MNIIKRIRRLENHLTPARDRELSEGEKQMAKLFGEKYIREAREKGFILDAFSEAVRYSFICDRKQKQPDK